MSPRIFSQSRNRLFAWNFRSRSETKSHLAISFSASWRPMNTFPHVIRIFELLFHPFTADATGGTLGPVHDAPSWDIPGRPALWRERRCEYFSIANSDV